MLDAPRLRYHWPYELQFEARLYQDMAIVEGLRGFVVLERQAGADADGGALQGEEDVQAFSTVGKDAGGAGENGFWRGDEHRAQLCVAVLPQGDGGKERGERGKDAPEVVADAPRQRAAQRFAVFENHGW